jgi:hypothetical protein
MREDPNAVYDRRRCRVCGVPWSEHEITSICSIYRPTDVAPAWVGEALARHELAATASNFQRPTADDAEIARREVAGGVPTREWPADGGGAERSGYIRVIDGEATKDGVNR